MSTLICCYVRRGEQAWLPIKVASADSGIHASSRMVTATDSTAIMYYLHRNALKAYNAITFPSAWRNPPWVQRKLLQRPHLPESSKVSAWVSNASGESGPEWPAEPEPGCYSLRPAARHHTAISLQNQNLPNKKHPSNWRELKLRETSKSGNEEQEVVICEGFFRSLFSLANLPRSSQSSCFSSRLSSDALNITSRCN